MEEGETAARRRAGGDLEVELALQRVRNEVLQMRGPEDWVKVVARLKQEIQTLVECAGCSITLIDPQDWTSELFFVDAQGALHHQRHAFVYPALRQAVERGRYVYRRNRAELSALADAVRPEVQAVIDVPFVGGTLAVSSPWESAFDERDIRILEQFAPAMSEAHRRLEDVRALALKEQELFQAQKLRTIGQLAAGVAHEINNPLTVINGLCQLLLEEELTPALRQDLEQIYRAGQRAAGIVQRLQAFARRQKLEKQWVDLGALVRETLEMVRSQAEANQVQLVEELQEGMPSAFVHPGQIQQVVLNLLQNSQEAILGTGSPGTIQVRLHQRGEGVVLEVEDDGPGIPEVIQTRIFEPFFTTREVGKGAGLGLSVSYRIAQEHEGRLRIKPTAVGACLELELPLSPG